MTKKKKVIVLSCMIALLAITAVFNFVLTNKDTESGVISTANYFSQYKTERTTTRNEQLLQLNEIIESEASTDQAKQEAIALKMKITEAMENELMLEYLMKTQGYSNVAVTIGTTTESVNVIVQDQELDQDDAVKIYTVVMNQIDVSPENVNIIPIN